MPETPAAEPVTDPGEAGMLAVLGDARAVVALVVSPLNVDSVAAFWGEATAGSSTFSRVKEGAASELGGGGGSSVEMPSSEGGSIGGAVGDIGDISWWPRGVVPSIGDCIPNIPSVPLWLPMALPGIAPM